MSPTVLPKGEPALCGGIGPLTLIFGRVTAAQVLHFLHQLSMSSRQRTQLVESLPNFEKRLVYSRRSTGPPLCIS